MSRPWPLCSHALLPHQMSLTEMLGPRVAYDTCLGPHSKVQMPGEGYPATLAYFLLAPDPAQSTPEGPFQHLWD